MTTLRLILGDQLSQSISSLEGYDASKDIILMCEVWDEATYVKHHKKKIAFLFSAMRHFAQELKQSGYRVEYAKLNDKNNKGKAPLNAVEGFIRQIMGWREYVRGIYWLKMPEYAEANFFGATRNLPDFYWTAHTQMNCLRQCVQETQKNAYAHHIQRLMVLGNFALLAGIDPKQVNEWFLIVYGDAYEWVELPNVSGMILFADGGYLASKPYAAGGSYINKMSDYCKNCNYQVTKKNGSDACPFNYLYWDFLARNRKKLQSNHRIGMMYKIYDRMNESKKQAIYDDSRHLLTHFEGKYLDEKK